MTPQPTPTAADLEAAQELMAQLQDSDWTLAAAQLEDELDCDVSAGYVKDHQMARFLSDPAGFSQQRRLKTLVYKALRALLTDCELGVGLSAAQVTGKRLLNERLQHPSAEIQQQLSAVLSEALSTSQDIPLSASAQTSLRQAIQSVLSEEDWDAISSAAAQSLHQHLRAVVALAKTA